MRESAIEKECSKLARDNGWLGRKLVTPGFKGAPDRMFLKGGVVLFVEFKGLKGHLARIQEYEHNRYSKAGFEVHVIDNVEDFRKLIA